MVIDGHGFHMVSHSHGFTIFHIRRRCRGLRSTAGGTWVEARRRQGTWHRQDGEDVLVVGALVQSWNEMDYD